MFKNTMVTILTMMGIVLGYVLAGNDRRDGVCLAGTDTLERCDEQRYEAIQGFVLTIAVIYLLLNLAIDVV
jgi:peptide/nickel transport system permease protein